MNLIRDKLLAQIAEQEKRLAGLERERKEAHRRLEATRDPNNETSMPMPLCVRRPSYRQRTVSL